MIVVDLGFGDAGKGLVTDFLVRMLQAHTVVRFNGGAQAGHNVVTAGGKHHTFSQFGSGTFVPGVRTYLSHNVVVHPTGLLKEAAHLAEVGVPDALERLTVSAAALVITPFHQAANRLRELERGRARHGSCGVGVGETVQDGLRAGSDAIRMGQLADVAALRQPLRRVQQRKRTELGAALAALSGLPAAGAERHVLEDPAVIDRWLESVQMLTGQITIDHEDMLGQTLASPGAVIFEGAHGVLLDERHGFHPHTTWADCTFQPAVELLQAHGYQGQTRRTGVLRTYATRHGPGPFPTETAELAGVLPELHNTDGPWQGPFRRGWPDFVLSRYALDVCRGADAIALTHTDALLRLPHWRVCARYAHAGKTAAALARAAKPDLDTQAALGRMLETVQPCYDALSLRASSSESAGEAYAELAGQMLCVPVCLTSSGPTASDVHIRRPLFDASTA